MCDLPPLNTIHVFDAAARHQNLSRAAEELNMTQSAVSYQIKQIEAFVVITPRFEAQSFAAGKLVALFDITATSGDGH